MVYDMETEEQNVEALVAFQTIAYKIMAPNFLPILLELSETYLNDAKKLWPEKFKDEWEEFHDIFPLYQTNNFFEPKTEEFRSYIGGICMSILQSQGYYMENKQVNFLDLWLQTHYKYSLMEQHVHGYGSQISGFYFLETPEKCSEVMIHDPRPGKVQISMPENDPNSISYASNSITLKPEPGMLLITNSWLPHSFTRHRSDEPIKFLHFDLSVSDVPECNLNNNSLIENNSEVEIV